MTATAHSKSQHGFARKKNWCEQATEGHTHKEELLMQRIMRAIMRCNEKMNPGTNACDCAEYIFKKIVEAAETGKLPA